MTIKKLTFTALCAVAIFASGCATSPAGTSPQVPLDVASFNYDPPETKAPGSAGMNIILVSPQFAQTFRYSGREPYQSFGESMAADFEEILTARGYTVQGPYDSYDSIVFSVKERGDLILEINIDIKQNDSGLTKTQESDFMSALILSTAGATPTPYYKVKGTIGLSGRLTFKASEPQTREKMWVKNIDIKPQLVSVSSNKAWNYSAMQTGGFYDDPGIHNPILVSLREIYHDALTQAYTYLEPQELQTLRPQIQRIKQRVGY